MLTLSALVVVARNARFERKELRNGVDQFRVLRKETQCTRHFFVCAERARHRIERDGVLCAQCVEHRLRTFNVSEMTVKINERIRDIRAAQHRRIRRAQRTVHRAPAFKLCELFVRAECEDVRHVVRSALAILSRIFLMREMRFFGAKRRQRAIPRILRRR